MIVHKYMMNQHAGIRRSHYPVPTRLAQTNVSKWVTSAGYQLQTSLLGLILTHVDILFEESFPLIKCRYG